MTSTLLQQHSTQATTTQATNTAAAAMAWSNEKLRFSCVDNIGIKQLWKLIALDTTNTNTKTTIKAAKTKTTNEKKHTQIPTSTSTTTMTMTPSPHANNNNNSNNNKDNLKLQQQQQQLQQLNSKNSNNNNTNNNNNNEKMNFENCENFADYLTNRDILPHNRMSLLKFLAINALELSAPATPVLLQQNQSKQQQHPNTNINKQPHGWMQLSGHPESIVPTSTGIVRKRIASINDSEVLAYQQIALEPQTMKIVPKFYGTLEENGEHFIELQDLLAGFKDPCVMDIKMGSRTFLESEVTNKTLRPDLYKKMIAVDPNAPTAEEQQLQAITKLRYMTFREAMSSSHTKGFRIEALRLRGRAPVKELKTVRTCEQITQTIEQFLGARKQTHKELIKRLKQIRAIMEQSPFFQRHEIVGSSIFIVYDDEKVGAWLIDFAKSKQLPANVCVNHRSDWIPGNAEEGLLKGMDELINSFENAYTRNCGRKCLQI